MARKPYEGPWRRIRLKVLARDHGLCQICGPGCTTQATEVDHVLEVNAGGAWWDEANLRAACHTCNQARKHSRGSRNWQTAVTYITLVVGPPGADLLAYVRTHCQASDLIVDERALQHSTGSAQAAALACSALVNDLRQGRVRVARAWITSHEPHAEALLPHHHSVLVDRGQGQPRGDHGAINDVDAWHAERRGMSAQSVGPSRRW